MIPLVLLAGFLGAGKTRLLTQLVPALGARGVRSRVIINDFENATIDASRLAALDALVTPLNGECVCCSSLRELLQQLYDTPPDAGSVMLIEANGATETDELLGHLTADTRLAHFTLPMQVTVVDGAHWQRRWWHNALERAQVRTATHVQLNWMEKLSASRRAAVEQSVREVNPHAHVIDAATMVDDLAALVQAVTQDAAFGGRTTVSADARTASHTHAHTHAHAHPFGSFSQDLPPVVDRAAFQQFVATLPGTVVRAKGLVRFADAPSAMWVWHRVPGRKAMRLDRSTFHDDAQTTALFIGVAMDTHDLGVRIAALTRSPNPST